MSDIEEVAKTTGKAIDATREAGSFLAGFFQGPLEQVAGIAEDFLRYVRADYQLRWIEKLKWSLKQRGLAGPTRAVPFKIAMSIIREASEEENDELQDRWARLLVNAADTASGVNVQPMYLSILKDLSPQDAQVLDSIYRVVATGGNDLVVEGSPIKFTVRLKVPPTVPEIFTAAPSLILPEMQLILSNLERLRLISQDKGYGGVAILGVVQQTLLGREFVRACSARA